MAKLKFSKLFEVGDYQVLITKNYEAEEEMFTVSQTTELEDCRPSLSLGFEKEKDCDKCFEDYNSKNAKKFLQQVKTMLNDIL